MSPNVSAALATSRWQTLVYPVDIVSLTGSVYSTCNRVQADRREQAMNQ